ncbi:aminotransferase class IV [Rubrivirga sp. IMCC43871]|uniref:aminotransferase class IV n=1 Tax=Rubrivirga sp. IMCC43871 TaxID=3391575 RepID=UPI00398FE6C4
MSAPRLLETMRADEGRVSLLDRHLARLTDSAGALGYPLDPAAARALVASRGGEGTQALRLTLGPGGDLDLSARPLASAPFETVWVDTEPLWEAGTWRCVYKTTARDHYAARAARAREHGADEAILTNLSGHVIEGTRTTVWAEIDGRLWTPPLAAGGLAGVMRAYLLDTRPEAGERTLTAGDLRVADALFLSNALRGWMPVRLVDAPNPGPAPGYIPPPRPDPSLT